MTRLRILLKNNNIKQREIADLIGVNVATVSYICSGRYSLRLKHAEMIADKYGVSVDWLMEDIFEEPKAVNRIERIKPLDKVYTEYIPPARPKIRIDDSAIRRRPLPRYAAK